MEIARRILPLIGDFHAALSHYSGKAWQGGIAYFPRDGQP